jgi:hypothetical protein
VKFHGDKKKYVIADRKQSDMASHYANSSLRGAEAGSQITEIQDYQLHDKD